MEYYLHEGKTDNHKDFGAMANEPRLFLDSIKHEKFAKIVSTIKAESWRAARRLVAWS